MKTNQIIFFPALLGFPFLGLLSSSPETIALGVISFSLLVLFFYTIKLMGGKPEEIEPELESMDSEEIQAWEIEGEEENFRDSVPAQKQNSESGEEEPEKEDPVLEEDPVGQDTPQELNAEPPREKPKFHILPFEEFQSENKVQVEARTGKHLPEAMDIQGFRKERFKKETLGPMLKHFVQDLPHRSKIDNALVCLFEKDNYHEFLIQRGRLFIDCDTDAYLEAEEDQIEGLKMGNYSLTDKSRKLLLPIYTPSRNYGAIVLESLSGFNEKDILILQSECNRFGMEWETRTEYELAILDPITLVYNKSHYLTILREKFLSQDRIGLFLLEITGSDDRENLISFLAEFHSFPIYRVDERILGFFLGEEEVESLNLSLDAAIRELDKQGFFAEFILGYSVRTPDMNSAMDWEEEAIQKLYLARKKSPVMNPT